MVNFRSDHGKSLQSLELWLDYKASLFYRTHFKIMNTMMMTLRARNQEMLMTLCNDEEDKHLIQRWLIGVLVWGSGTLLRMEIDHHSAWVAHSAALYQLNDTSFLPLEHYWTILLESKQSKEKWKIWMNWKMFLASNTLLCEYLLVWPQPRWYHSRDDVMQINTDALVSLQIFLNEKHASIYSDAVKEGLSIYGRYCHFRQPFRLTRH